MLTAPDLAPLPITIFRRSTDIHQHVIDVSYSNICSFSSWNPLLWRGLWPLAFALLGPVAGSSTVVWFVLHCWPFPDSPQIAITLTDSLSGSNLSVCKPLLPSQSHPIPSQLPRLRTPSIPPSHETARCTNSC
jgi:hypothetical protein